MEINKAAVEYGRKHNPKFSFSSTWSQLKDADYDYAFSFDSLGHHPSPMDTLMCLRREMKIGGRVFISLTFEHGVIGTSAKSVYGRVWFAGDKHQHLYTWNPLILGNLMTNSGFDVVKCTNSEQVNDEHLATGSHLSGAGTGGPIEKLQIWCEGVTR